MTKHTKGPWQVKFWKAANYVTLHIQACNEKAEWIARIENREESEANAALISAAPEMLEALKLALSLFPNEMRGSLVEAAIAKAEGKTP